MSRRPRLLDLFCCQGGAAAGYVAAGFDFYHAVGNFSNVDYVRRDLRVPWMTRDGVRECIPPIYAEHVGRYARSLVRA